MNHNRALAVRKFNINPQSAIDWMAQEGVIRSKSPTEVPSHPVISSIDRSLA